LQLSIRNLCYFGFSIFDREHRLSCRIALKDRVKSIKNICPIFIRNRETIIPPATLIKGIGLQTSAMSVYVDKKTTVGIRVTG
jgi:hypothetical protein